MRPELEIFDTGHLWFANKLVDEGLIDAPAMYQLCMGIPYGAPPEPALLAAMVAQIPPGVVWASFAIGRMQMPWVAQSVLLGGHVRVGLEDNLYLGRGNKVTNAQLVANAVTIITRDGRRGGHAGRGPRDPRAAASDGERDRRRVRTPTGRCAPSPASGPGSSAAAGWRTSWPAGSAVRAWDPAPDAEARLRAIVDAAWPALTELGLAAGASPWTT